MFNDHSAIRVGIGRAELKKLDLGFLIRICTLGNPGTKVFGASSLIIIIIILAWKYENLLPCYICPRRGVLPFHRMPQGCK